MKTRKEQQDQDPRYADWRAAYIEDVRERVKHWGSKRKNAAKLYRSDNEALDGAFAPGGDAE